MTTAVRTPGAIGAATDRVDGPLKVTGAARYAADTPVQAPLYGVLVTSAVARGRITAIDETATRAIEGVVEVVTYRNAPRLQPTSFDFTIPTVYVEGGLMPLQTDRVCYWGQFVAAVVATTFEAARAGAAVLHISYAAEPAALTLAAGRAGAEPVPEFFGSAIDVQRGDVEGALASAATAVDATYTTPDETHNPLEPSATIAQWGDDGTLTVHDATQWIMGTRNTLAHFFDLPPEKVRVICPFVGGGFGCKGFIWPHTVIASLAAKLVRKPVKVVLDRTQFFTSTGYRPQTEQRLRLGADAAGKLTAIDHDVLVPTSRVADWMEPCGKTTPWLYDVPNVRTTHRMARIDVATPTAMRAPGEAPGSFALESAMDELAVALGVDPLELRIRNHADVDRTTGNPFSSKHLLACYREGARRFGWERRPAAPRTLRDGNELVGYGMATATYPAFSSPTEVRVRVEPDLRVAVECATHDLGTGMYTIATQVAADALGVPIERVIVRIGDSAYPNAPVAGGSQSTASVTPAIAAACRALLEQTGGTIDARAIGTEARAGAGGDYDEEHFSYHSFGAQFCEVHVDEELASARVSRFVGVFDGGRILNPKTARSQMIGGIIMGIGMALFEESVRDPRSGAVVTNNFADYRVATNADIPPIEVAFIEEPDLRLNALGVRGIGEIAITGVAAAVANAVYHATGKRIRNLPILPEKLL
jgi:xanthine dehydrogenase YagR molybdenum-binding subunit